MKLKLKREWQLGERIGSGGFGRVFEALGDDGTLAAVKLVPKAPGAQRELLFGNLQGARNVVPIIDSGETRDSWVLVMPKADKSLRQFLEASPDTRVNVSDALSVLRDLAEALTDLEGRAVHRDVKPENILLLNGAWCLADFGISRYAEATTAPDTQKFALTSAYAAPERWRGERASIAADVYSVGIVAYEMLAGKRPFTGDDAGLRDLHLHASPPPIGGVAPTIAALIDECLYKAPEARPRPANLAARLARVSDSRLSAGLTKLQEANKSEVSRRSEHERRASQAKSESERRSDLAAAGASGFERISDELRESLLSAAPAATLSASNGVRWRMSMGHANLALAEPVKTVPHPWGDRDAPSFTVILHSTLSLHIPRARDRRQYEGRSHSLWYCDGIRRGEFQWLETAFMISPLIPRRAALDPFALDPGIEAAKAFWKGIAEFQVAWSWTPLIVGELAEFVDRWASWFADASSGELQHPSHMPER